MTVGVSCPFCLKDIHTGPRIPAKEERTPLAFPRVACTFMGNQHSAIYWCDDCLLGFLHPLPESQQLLLAYEAVEDPLYLKEQQGRYQTFAHQLKIVKQVCPQGKLLEVGSYCGFFLELAHQAGYEVLGVEPSQWAAGYTRNVLGLPVLNHSIEDQILQKTLKEQAPFDVIVAWDVLEHLHDPLFFLNMIHSLLKPGGFFLFSTLDVSHWWVRLLGKYWPWYTQAHLYYFTRKGLICWLNQVGFKVTQQQPYRHVVSAQYLLHKLHYFLKVKSLPFLKPNSLLEKIFVPFQLGDVVLMVAQKQDSL